MALMYRVKNLKDNHWFWLTEEQYQARKGDVIMHYKRDKSPKVIVDDVPLPGADVSAPADTEPAVDHTGPKVKGKRASNKPDSDVAPSDAPVKKTWSRKKKV